MYTGLCRAKPEFQPAPHEILVKKFVEELEYHNKSNCGVKIQYLIKLRGSISAHMADMMSKQLNVNVQESGTK